MIIFILLAIVIVLGSCGDVCVKRGMKAVGEIASFAPAALFAAAVRTVQNGFIWMGIGCKTIAFFTLLALLSRADLSWVAPAAASIYVLDTLAAKYLLGETINRSRWAGAFCVCLGVALLSF